MSVTFPSFPEVAPGHPQIGHLTWSGVDGTVAPANVVAAAADCEVPVELGVQISASRAGREGYPTFKRVDAILSAVAARKKSTVWVALHVNGRLAREFFEGHQEPRLHNWLNELKVRRVQLNVDAQRDLDVAAVESHAAALRSAQAKPILQARDGNWAWLEALDGLEARFDVLHDQSLGNGVMPERWHGAYKERSTGYAGGLAPETFACAIPLIAAAHGGQDDIWIDAQNGLRDATSERETAFSVRRARALATQVADWNARAANPPLPPET